MINDKKMTENNILADKTIDFSIRIIRCYKYLTEEVVALYEEQPDRRFKRTLINIIRAEIHKNEIVFETSHIDNANIQGVIRERDVVFAGKVRLVVECSFKDEE